MRPWVSLSLSLISSGIMSIELNTIVKEPWKGLFKWAFPKVKRGWYFFHRIFLTSTAVSSLIAMLCPLPGGVKRDRTCLDDSTQLRVMLPDSRPVVVMAPKMTSLHLWFPKGPRKAQNCQSSLIWPHSYIRGQKLLLSAQRWSQYPWGTSLVTDQPPNIP